MKPTGIHPVSALVGSALAGLVFIALGAAQQSSLLRIGPVQVKGIPSPQQMMRVVEPATFTVPNDKLFVVTGLGSTSTSADVSVTATFDSLAVLTTILRSPTQGTAGQGIHAVPPGLVATAATGVSVSDNTAQDGVLLGYLVDL